MKLNIGVCILLACSLSACKSTPEKPSGLSEAATPLPSPTPSVEKVADKPFDPDTLYSLLVAEMAIDRQRYDIALGNYVQQATSTQDPLVAGRATQIARGLNARQSALEMAQLWAKLDPTDSDANIYAVNELIQAGDFIKAFELSKQLHDSGEEKTSFDRIAVAAEKASPEVQQQLLENYQALSTQSNHPDLWVGYSMLLLNNEDFDAALSAAEKAGELDGKSITSSFQQSRVLQAMGRPQEAREKLAQLVEENPQNIGLRARFARMLWHEAPEEAEKQFEILHELSPHDPEILYSLALVKKERAKLEEARGYFNKLLELQQYPDAAHFYLGDIEEQADNEDKALEHYFQVNGGQNYGAALVRITDILRKQQKNDQALAFIKSEKARSEGPQLEALFLIEADLHSQASRMKLAEDALSSGIAEFPESTRLLYARAMLYAQIDYISAAEKDLKQVLTLVPDNAAALNALGYTLADRTERLDEAAQYIKRAYEITPDDPAVMDSMGWVAFRQGNNEEALTYLKKAMLAMPDHEIAAHLGEVLWVIGEKEAAIAIWKKGLELQPESEIIHKTLHRLDASIE